MSQNTKRFVPLFTFKVATSYEDSMRMEKQFSTRNKERTDAFAKLENKEALAQNLRFTKPCLNTQKNDQGHFGVCTRVVCTFAHSLDELRIAQCVFGNNCKRRDCRFQHPTENAEQFYQRTGVSKPDLPQTSEFTHIPAQEPELETTPLKRCDAMIVPSV